jgi:CheY-like chemotaxis protein
VRIGVEDTGRGIDAESIDKLFTPFERLGARSAGVQGTGLGLVLSRNLVEAMGGTIGVESGPSGSTFWIDLEAAGPEPEAAEGGDDKVLEVRDYGVARRLLYVEDGIANVRLIEELLRRRPRVRLVPAMLGQMGLDLARQHRPDLILLDLDLPDLGGEEVLARLRGDTATRGIPVVVLTDGAEGGVPGASACLAKPIGVRRLLEVLDRFLA